MSSSIPSSSSSSTANGHGVGSRFRSLAVGTVALATVLGGLMRIYRKHSSTQFPSSPPSSPTGTYHLHHLHTDGHTPGGHHLGVSHGIPTQIKEVPAFLKHLVHTTEQPFLHRGVYISEYGRFAHLRHTFMKDGLSKLQIIADFDRTLTAYYLPNGHICTSSHGMLENSSFFPAHYKAEIDALNHYYFPFELSADMEKHEREMKMIEWWVFAHLLMIKYGMRKSWIEKSVRDAIQRGDPLLRAYATELFSFAALRQIPFLIFSAGLSDNIELYLREKHLFFRNMHIVSNAMTFQPARYHAQHARVEKQPLSLAEVSELSALILADNNGSSGAPRQAVHDHVQQLLDALGITVHVPDSMEACTRANTRFPCPYFTTEEERKQQQQQQQQQAAADATPATGAADATADGEYVPDLLTGFSTPLIHIMNKNYTHVKGTKHEELTKDKKNVILLGDNHGDAHMADGIRDGCEVLRFGLLHENIQPRFDAFSRAFDVLLLQDCDLSFVLELLQDIQNSSDLTDPSKPAAATAAVSASAAATAPAAATTSSATSTTTTTPTTTAATSNSSATANPTQ